MNADTPHMRELAADALPAPLVAPSWRTILPLIVAAIALVIAVYWRTAWSIVSIWIRSETFAHGFLIVPASLYLVYARRREIARLTPRPDVLGLAMLAVSGLAWLVATAGQVQVVAQFALVAMVPSVVTALAGRRVAWALLFPLGFLFFAVPVGEALVPPLMDWTATFTVEALRLTGIPIYREGTFFTIPSGQWSVVEGCSGVRYLIASVTVGALYAYLNYRKAWKRALFVVLSILVPILANGLRAYLIVMIAHLSGMKLALGVDHLIYGWVFFGIVMLLLFWIGSYWRDEPPPAGAVSRPAAPIVTRRDHLALIAFATAGLIIPWQLYATYLDRDRESAPRIALASPLPAGGWTLATDGVTDWRPRYGGTATTLYQEYRKGTDVVGVWIGFYPRQAREAQLVTTQNQIVVQKHPVWSNVGESARSEMLGASTVSVRETRLRSPAQRLLVWDWYNIAGRDLSSPVLAKILFARARLLTGDDMGTAVIVATPYEGDPAAARATLRRFTKDMLPAVHQTIAGAEREYHAGR